MKISDITKKYIKEKYNIEDCRKMISKEINVVMDVTSALENMDAMEFENFDEWQKHLLTNIQNVDDSFDAKNKFKFIYEIYYNEVNVKFEYLTIKEKFETNDEAILRLQRQEKKVIRDELDKQKRYEQYIELQKEFQTLLTNNL